MFRVVIIDDEVNVRIVLKKLLSLLYVDCEVVGEAGSIKLGKEVILSVKPDIVLLDINLEDGSGFGLLELIPNRKFKLIFITAFDEYAIRAFKFNAIDYLLKPIDPDELKKAINSAKNAVNSEDGLDFLLKNIAENKGIEAKDNSFKKLVIKTNQRTYFILLSEILYFESDGSYSKVVTEKTTILASKNIKYFQEILPKEMFIRTHKSFLVNKLPIVSVKDNNVILNNDIKVPISVRKKAEILNILSK